MKNLEGLLRQKFHGRKILITGHTGFKGGWLSLWLEAMGAEIIGYSLDPPSEPSFFNATNLSDRLIDERGDILDGPHLSEIINEHRPEFIFHLAAQSLVRQSYVNPLHTFNVNVVGTASLLESIRLAQHPVVCICVTSDKCYENREWDYAYRENDPMGGHDPYSASKGAAELIISSYRRSFFNTVNQEIQGCCLSSVRAGNIIGGGDWAEDRIVPDCIRALVKKSKIQVRNPSAVRPWQFVLDPLCGYLLLAARMKENPELFSDSWNFGPFSGNTIDVRTLADSVIEEWGGGDWEDVSGAEKSAVHEAKNLKLDITKTTTRLGWKPVFNIRDAVGKTVQWYKNYHAGRTDPYAFSMEQINSYMKNAGNVYGPK